MGGGSLSLFAGGLILLAGLASCALTSSDEDVNSRLTIASPGDWEDARIAIQKAGQNRTYFFTIEGSVPIPSSGPSVPTFGHVEGLIVNFRGTGKLFLEGQGNLLYIGDKQTMIIDGPTLEGLRANVSDPSSNDNTTAAVCVASGGRLEMKSGSITGNTVNAPQHSRFGGGGVIVRGIFIMDGGEISGNESAYGNGGGVSVSAAGSFIMNDGTISGNTASANTGSGGGVSVAGEGIFIMSGGALKGNTAMHRGGGVYISGLTASFYKSGGTLYGTDPNPQHQNTTAKPNTDSGHAAFYSQDASNEYYCSATLSGSGGGGIDTRSNLPAVSGESRGNWTKL